MRIKETVVEFNQELVNLVLFFLSIHIPLRIFAFVANEYSLFVVVLYSIIVILSGFIAIVFPRISFSILALSGLSLILLYLINLDYNLTTIFQVVIGSIYIFVFQIIICYKYFCLFIVVEPPKVEMEIQPSKAKNKLKLKLGWRRASRRNRSKSVLSTKLSSGKYRG